MRVPTRVYQVLVRADRGGQDLGEQREIGRNGLRQVLANALQSMGDQVVDAKTVLAWALTSIGAPGFFLALLVPLRESGSMLPQAAMAPALLRAPLRVRFWLWGAAGQAFSTAGMAFAIATLSGWAGGVAVASMLACFALARSLNSLAGKDVLGRTVPKGERGQINGISTTLSGAAAVSLGVGIRVLGGDEVSVSVLAWLLGGASLAWVLALVVYAGIREPAATVDPGTGAPGAAEAGSSTDEPGWVASSWNTLRAEPPFRRFVMVRALLLVSALSPPFVVALAAERGGAGLRGLGPFVIASGVAGLLGGRAFGRLADRSARALMMLAALAGSLVVLAFLVAVSLIPAPPEPSAGWVEWIYPGTFFALALAHTGVRVARKTYVVDMAGEDRRTRYVAVSNTAISVVLLIVGALAGALALVGSTAALLFLAVLGLVGVVLARSLPEVSAGREDAAVARA